MLLFLIGLLLLGRHTYAQPRHAKNTLFAEVGGNAWLYSLNYDRILYQGKSLGVTGRVGVSYYFQTLFLPLEVNLLLGRHKHHLEVGIGVTPFLYHWERTEYVSGQPLVTASRRVVNNWSFLRAGYRFQDPEGGFFFRAGFTPPVLREGHLAPFIWGGLSVGKSF